MLKLASMIGFGLMALPSWTSWSPAQPLGPVQRSRATQGTPEIRRHLDSRTPILTYHDVIERRDSESLWFDCSVSEFIAQLDWMAARGAHFVSLDQIYSRLTAGAPLPAHAVAI